MKKTFFPKLKSIGFITLMFGLASAELNAEVFEDFEYWVIGYRASQTVEITRYTGSAAQVAIPDKINGLPVTEIG